MQRMQHICGNFVNIDAFQSHGEIILYIEDADTGQQVESCPECGEVIIERELFELDIFPAMCAELGESLVMEV